MIQAVRKGRQLTQKLRNLTHDSMFRFIHSRTLIYNTCWEDPRLDRQMLQMGPGSRVVMITSAGCNALDYLLDDPAEIHAIDVNPRQNALLELKLALLAKGDPAELWRVFGEGVRPQFRELLESLKPWLSHETWEFWWSKHHYFEGKGQRRTFLHRGAAGSVAWAVLEGLERVSPGGQKLLARFLEAHTMQEQSQRYAEVQTKFWNAFNRWLVRQPFTMALLGVPRPQIQLIQSQYPGGLGRYIQDKMEHTLTRLPIGENYFWRAYALGSYARSCCPNYLKAENFAPLQARAEKLRLHTMTVSEFLEAHPGAYTHFVLLDHQDWLASHNPEALEQEWELILANSAPGAKVLMRSASPRIEFIPPKIAQRLRLNPVAERFHAEDRVGTYGCTLLAELP